MSVDRETYSPVGGRENSAELKMEHKNNLCLDCHEKECYNDSFLLFLCSGINKKYALCFKG